MLLNRQTRRTTSLALTALTFHAALLVPGLPYFGGVAYAAPPSTPSVLLLPIHNVGNSVPSIVVSRVDEYYRTLTAMDATVRSVEANSSGVAVPTAPIPAPIAAPEPVLSAMPPDKDVEAGLKAIDAGRELLLAKKFAPAAKKLDSAINAIGKKFHRLDDFARLTEAYVLLAAARFGQSYDEDAEEALMQALVVEPNLTIDPRWDSPPLRAAFDRLRATLQQVPTGTIQVNCAEPTCAVYVDGRLEGTGSASVVGLPRGSHWIRTVTPGFEPFAAKLFTPGVGETKTVVASSKKLAAGAATRTAPAAAPRTPPPLAMNGPASPEVLQAFVREGAFGPAYLGQASALARQSGATHVVATVVNRDGNQIAIASFVYSLADNKVAEVSGTRLAADTSDLQVRVLVHEEQVSAAVHTFPAAKVVKALPPPIYAVAVAVAPTRPTAPTPPIVVAVAPPSFTPAPIPTAPVPATPSPYTPAPIAPPTANPTVPPPPNILPMGTAPVVPGFPQPVYTQPTAPAYTPPGFPTAPNTPPAYTPPSFTPAPITPPVANVPAPTTPTYVPPSSPGYPPSVVRVPPPTSQIEDTSSSDDAPVYKTWWFWTIIGVVVAGGATAAGVLLAPSDAPAPDGFTTNVTFE